MDGQLVFPNGKMILKMLMMQLLDMENFLHLKVLLTQNRLAV